MTKTRARLRSASRAVGRVFMASFLAYFLKIAFDGMVAAVAIRLAPHLSGWAGRWILAPITLELGTILAVLVSVYLLVRFAAVPWWGAVLGTGALLEAWFLASMWIMGLWDAYVTVPALVTRALGAVLYTYLGYLVWRKVGVKDG